MFSDLCHPLTAPLVTGGPTFAKGNRVLTVTSLTTSIVSGHAQASCSMVISSCPTSRRA